MKIKLGTLRRIIREAGLDADMRHMAGSVGVGGMGVSSPHRDRESTVMDPLGNLGSSGEEQEHEDDLMNFVHGDPEQKNQPGARVYDRAGGDVKSDYDKRLGR